MPATRHSLQYAKNLPKVNHSVPRLTFSFTDGVIDRAIAKQFDIVGGKLRVKEMNPSTPLRQAQGESLRAGKRTPQKKTEFIPHKNTFFRGLAAVLVLLNVVVPLSAFEAHILNVTATIKSRVCNVATFDTDAGGLPILSGQIIDDEYDGWGLAISADNNHPNIPDLSIAFPSENPTGGDTDLGTPNEDFIGPGIGAGGGLGEPGENSRLERNLLIIAQDNVDADNNGYIDDPSDEPDGGWIWFRFDAPTRVESLRLLDIETSGVKIDVYNAADILDETIYVSSLGDNSSQYIPINKEGVKKIGVWLTGEGAVNDLCFDPVEKPTLCDARSKGYWANNEGCHQGTGDSEWTSEVNTLSDTYADIFATSTGSQICSFIWTPNCPSGNSKPARICKARTHLLADELNVVSGKLQLDAFIAGADDGDSAFDHLSLTPFSTVGQAIGMIEAVLADSNSSKGLINDAGYIAKRIYEFYEEENPFAPECVFDPDDVPQCLAPLNAHINIHNDADIENDIETSSNTGDNSADGGDAHSTSSGQATSTANGGDGGDIETGDATSTSEVINVVNETIIEIGGEATTTDSAPSTGSGQESSPQATPGEEEETIIIEESSVERSSTDTGGEMDSIDSPLNEDGEDDGTSTPDETATLPEEETGIGNGE